VPDRESPESVLKGEEDGGLEELGADLTADDKRTGNSMSTQKS
jgi:hypothetical protein